MAAPEVVHPPSADINVGRSFDTGNAPENIGAGIRLELDKRNLQRNHSLNGTLLDPLREIQKPFGH